MLRSRRSLSDNIDPATRNRIKSLQTVNRESSENAGELTAPIKKFESVLAAILKRVMPQKLLQPKEGRYDRFSVRLGTDAALLADFELHIRYMRANHENPAVFEELLDARSSCLYPGKVSTETVLGATDKRGE
jgi:hypothetical protein